MTSRTRIADSSTDRDVVGLLGGLGTAAAVPSSCWRSDRTSSARRTMTVLIGSRAPGDALVTHGVVSIDTPEGTVTTRTRGAAAESASTGRSRC